MSNSVLLTDHPWPDTAVEQEILSAAGIELREAPPGVTDAELAELARQVCGILTCWAPVSAMMITAAGADLRVISRLGVGVDNIDIVTAQSAGIVVTYVPGYCAEEVSDHVLALVYAWARHLRWYDSETRAGIWSPLSRLGRRVCDLTVGVLGPGANGLRTAEKFRGLGCRVLVQSRADIAQLTEFVSSVDVLTLHLPLRNDTRGMLSAQLLSAMRPGSLLVNTARGQLIETKALLSALDRGRPGFAALDVLDTEPVIGDELREHPNVMITPHVAFASSSSIDEVRRRACLDLVRVIRGEAPTCAVGPDRSARA